MPQPHLTANLACRARGVARHDLDADACIETILHGVGHIVANGVDDAYNAEETKVLNRQLAVGKHRLHLVFGNVFVRKAQRTQSLALVFQQLAFDLLFGPNNASLPIAFPHRGATFQQHLRGTFHIQHILARERRLDHRGHVFVFRCKRQLANDLHFVANPDKVDIVVEKPQQQGALGRITDHLHLLLVAVIQECRRVDRYAFLHQMAHLRIVDLAVLQAINEAIAQTHAVFGERSRLVGANHRSGAHGLTSMHLAHQVIGLQHPAHTQCQTQRNAHGQALWHRHHNQRDGNHEGIEQVSGEIHPLEGHVVAIDEIHQQTEHDDQSGDDIAGNGDAITEFVELFVKRCLHLIVDLRTAIHLAPLCLIAHLVDHENAMAFHHGAATTDVVGRIGGLGLELRLVGGLATRRLARQVRFVDAHGHSLHQRAVSRHLVARVQHHGVAHHNVLSFDALDEAATVDRHLGLVFGLVQDVELLVGTQFKDKAYRRGQHHCHENAQRLQQHRPSCGAGTQLVDGNAYRQQQGNQQNAYDRIGKLLQKLFPKGLFLGWSQHIGAMCGTAFLHFFLRQSILIVSSHLSFVKICYFCIEKTRQKYNLVTN